MARLGRGRVARLVVSDATSLDAAAVRALTPAALYSLDGKVAVVTGASGGLGRWFAAGLGAAGAAVLATDLERGRSTSSSRCCARRASRPRAQ